jgi:hypothetical protein
VVLTTGTADLSARLGVRILPNPNSGDFHVEFKSSESGPATLTLLDMQGRLLQRMETVLHQAVTDVHFENPDLDKGIYQLVVRTESGSVTYKVIVQ